MDLFERMKRGELIRLDDPDYPQVYDQIMRAFRLTGQLNSSYHDADQARTLLSELFGQRQHH